MRVTKGYTLIEILIVMVIISIIATIAAFTITTNRRTQLHSFSQKIVNIFLLAENEAILRPATIGAAFSSTDLQFYLFKNNQWQLITKPPLKKNAIPQDMAVTVKMNKKILPSNGIPVIIFSQNGDISPFEIFIGKKAQPPIFRITGSANGDITIHAQ